MLTDLIADLLTRLRNASLAQKRHVEVRGSKLVLRMVEILKEEGFVSHYLTKEEKGVISLRVFLKYDETRAPVIRGLRRVSKPGLRQYVGHERIPNVLRGLGVAIVSTSQGVMTGREAKKKRVGGELLCLVW